MRSEGAYHIETFPSEGQFVRGFFYKKNNGLFNMKLEVDDEEIDCGEWPGIAEAYGAIPRFLGLNNDPLKSWRRGGYNLIVCRERRTGKWLVVAARGKAFLDTGTRFDRESDARIAANGR